MPKRRFSRYMLQPIPKKLDVAGAELHKHMKRGTRTFKGQDKKDKPKPDVRAYPKAGAAGSKSNPFKSKRAARQAGYKTGDLVHWKYGDRIRNRL